MIKIQRPHLKPLTLSACLQVCKKNKVSFTAIPHTLISITLAVNIYPEEKSNNSSTQISFQVFMGVQTTDIREVTQHGIMNLTSTFNYLPWLGAYRAAEIPSTPASSNKTGRKTAIINRTVFCDLARNYMTALGDAIAFPRSKPTPCIQDVLSMLKMMPAEEEPLANQVFPGMNTVLENSWSLSNLGAFADPAQLPEVGAWSITDMEFSAAATKPAVAPPIYFAVISV